MALLDAILGAADGVLVGQPLAMANRHGLITGATGTGKTITLQVLAEAFSRQGVPVFAADAKGDLSGIAAAGKPSTRIDERLKSIPLPSFEHRGCPTVFWDVYGQTGHPVRTTVSELGPLLLANLFELSEAQAGALYAAFKIADDRGLLLLDLKDLRAMLSFVADNASELRSEYGNLAPATLGAIQRRLLVLEEQGADLFFGEPALALADLMRCDFSGQGVVSVLDASRLMREAPRVYACLLLWLLSELFEDLPEAGDLDRPKLVLFFDEAHLLFESAPKPLLDKVEQVVRLIRSKGVGVYFITQSPLDVPQSVLGQLGLKVQHALRAFTPDDHKVIRAVASGFRARPGVDVARTVTELATGEALVSVLDSGGAPTPVARTLIAPPESRIGPLTAEERAERIARSPLKGTYEATLDRESAYEVLKKKAARADETRANETAAREVRPPPKARTRESAGEAMLKSTVRAIGSSLGRQLVRGILGSLSRR